MRTLLYIGGVFRSAEAAGRLRRSLDTVAARLSAEVVEHAPRWTDGGKRILERISEEVYWPEVVGVVGFGEGSFLAMNRWRNTARSTALVNPILQPKAFPDVVWDKPSLQALRRLDVVPVRKRDSGPLLVLVESDDEVVDQTAVTMRLTGVARVVAFRGGSHDFNHHAEAERVLTEHLGVVAK